MRVRINDDDTLTLLDGTGDPLSDLIGDLQINEINSLDECELYAVRACMINHRYSPNAEEFYRHWLGITRANADKITVPLGKLRYAIFTLAYGGNGAPADTYLMLAARLKAA